MRTLAASEPDVRVAVRSVIMKFPAASTAIDPGTIST